jgi:hypothetical protein
MNNTLRMTAVGILTVLAAGLMQLVAAPAQASTQYGCPDNYVCLYDHYAYNYNYDGPPSVKIPIQTLTDAGYNTGRNLANWGFDNKTTCALNNSRSGTGYKTVWFNQFNDQTGFYWEIPAMYGACWDGWWRDNRASRIGVRPL